VERWLVQMEAGRPEAAWDAFLDRYRALLFAAIRHYVRDYDDVMDVFTWVCESLRADDFRRLRQYSAEPEHRARFTTWLVVVVRNLTVDWLRRRDGRPRAPHDADGLTPTQHLIFAEVYTRQRTHAEAFELIRSRSEPELTFARFLKELAVVHRTVTEERGWLTRERSTPVREDVPGPARDPVVGAETGIILKRALSSLPATDRVAVQMYVIDELAATEIARVLGLPNAKAVYNRVYRALQAVRDALTRAGLGREDL
jgi:RNA polymerase sigma factor (sigma-70 family)